MITKVKICDVCKRNENDMNCNIYSHKVKRENKLHPGRWDKIDICYDCLTDIRRKVKYIQEFNILK